MSLKAKIIILMATALILPFAGCFHGENPGETRQLSSRPITIQQPTAVESAIALSDKYAKLSDEASALRQQKQTLEAENKRLKEEMQACRTKLDEAQKELSEVNDLMVEMRLELNNWKTDVLGFRGEMREAEKAQLEALLKILKLMGGEVNQAADLQPAKEEQK